MDRIMTTVIVVLLSLILCLSMFRLGQWSAGDRHSDGELKITGEGAVTVPQHIHSTTPETEEGK
jgi:hypothetical protein